jgi:hypothetical protein
MSGWFSLEAVYAKKGDALILHYGTKNKPRWILIDGGHTGVYDEFLRPRFEELRLHFADRLVKERLPLEMVMVSHADEDHLAGLLDLTAHLRQSASREPAPPVTFDKLWFNGFDDLIANPVTPAARDTVAGMAELASAGGMDLPDTAGDVRAVIASTRQGRQLLQDAAALVIDVNEEFGGELVMRGAAHSAVTTHGDGLTLHVIGPDKKRIDKLRAQWKKDLEAILKKEKEAADVQSFKDSSPFNLSSIIVLAKRRGKSMLLTGDARGDDLHTWLGEEGLLNSDKLEVDLFKVPHHGSDRNVTAETFRDITAKHYVISANGEHENPEPATLDMLVAGRKQTRTDAFHLHLTFPFEAFKLIPESLANQKKKVRKQKDTLEAVDHWLKTKKPSNMKVHYRAAERFSLAVNLDTEKVFPGPDGG